MSRTKIENIIIKKGCAQISKESKFNIQKSDKNGVHYQHNIIINVKGK